MQLFLQTCSPNLDQSKTYFSKLNFELVDQENFSIVYDKQFSILLDHDRGARTGLTLIKENWDEELSKLKYFVPIISKEQTHYFASPSGTRFKLVTGYNMDIPSTQTQSMLGNYAGVSLETMDIEKSLKILSCFGFSKSAGGIDQGWISCTDSHENSVSLMEPFSCPHTFTNPSGTFFNSGKNPQIIANIRETDIPIYEEVSVFNTNGEIDNIIMREPGGLGFFVFND